MRALPWIGRGPPAADGLRRPGRWCRAWALACLALAPAGFWPPPALGAGEVLTNLAQLQGRVALQAPAGSRRQVVCDLDFEAAICAVNPALGLVAVADASGAEALWLDRLGRLPIPGQVVRFVGRGCEVRWRELGYEVRGTAVVTNDGTHSMQEASGKVRLPGGPAPIRLEWFNSLGGSGLTVEWEGPGLARQPVSLQSLSHPAGQGRVPGLQWAYYEGAWQQLPEFWQFVPARRGTSPVFDIQVALRTNEIGLQFEGHIDVPAPGDYTFHVTSDDGTRLYVGPGPLEWTRVRSAGDWAGGEALNPAVVWESPAMGRWGVVEGEVTFVSRRPYGLELELRAGREPVRVRMGGDQPEPVLLHSRVRLQGVAQTVFELDGRRRLGLMSVVAPEGVRVIDAAPEMWVRVPLSHLAGAEGEGLKRVRGRWMEEGPGQGALERDGTRLAVDLGDGRGWPVGTELEAVGLLATNDTGRVLRWAVAREVAPADDDRAVARLTTGAQIHRLSRAEAERMHPATLRGVVTASDFYQGMVLQDETRGIYVDFEARPAGAGPQVGEFWEVEGVTGPGLFAPMLKAQTLRYLGLGRLPEPARPAWAQLMGGSLDTQYGELNGIITRAGDQQVTLLMHGGKIEVGLQGLREAELKPYENTLVRVRGCLLARWNPETHEVRVGEIEVRNPVLAVDSPAAADPFAAPGKTIRELLQFSAGAANFERVTVRGQVIGHWDGEWFMMSEGSGLRFVPRAPAGWAEGDWVEVAGIPELGGASPVLREAVARRTGSGPLPPARPVRPEELVRAELDATRVRVSAQVLNMPRPAPRQAPVLEVQAGLRVFPARVLNGVPPALQPGTRVELTGVYVGQGLGPDRQLEAFDLVLTSPAGIRVLAVPPWWTLPRMLALVGMLALVCAGALLWVATLRRQVQEQTRVIRDQVKQQAILEERARIARELHDTLEQALAAISLQLNALTATLRQAPEEAQTILKMTRSMVRHGQEEARRTVNNLRLLALERADLRGALRQLAQDLAAGDDTRVQVEIAGAPRPLPPKVESQLLRVAQEATTNALKHAEASHIRLRLDFHPGRVGLTIEDDGRGFDSRRAHQTGAGHFGLLGMRERVEQVQGTLQIISAPGEGTRIQVSLPLDPPSTSYPTA